MNSQKDRSTFPPPNLPASLLPVVPAAANGTGSVTSVTSDCLYQFAALTAGAFLLATMI
jgi:hypothetical protein